MKILVTGGSGRIGRYVVRELVESGHNVTSIDISPWTDSPCRTMRIDMTKAGEVYQALASAQAEAVVHLAAWANAGIVPDTDTYGDNVKGAFNLFQACANLGIKRIISASSAQVYGLAKAPPVYVPLDEAHPLRPANSYALSKMASEQAADYFIARWELTILSFRFMGIRAPTELDKEIEQMAQYPRSGARLLWTLTDARDAALACRLALEAEDVPSGPYNITGSRIVLSEPTAKLIEQYFGSQTKIMKPIPDHSSPMSCTRAEAAFGYHPRFLWSVTQRHPED